MTLVPEPNTSGSTLVYRTGPFAPNPNYGRYFNDGNIARKYSPSEFRDLTQSIAFEDGEMCSGIETSYSLGSGSTAKISTKHPHIPDGSAKTPKDWTANTIKSIVGCSTARINSLDYSSNIDGSDAYKCGTSTRGHGYNAYPFQFTRDRCHFLYFSGYTFKKDNGWTVFTDLYFYWSC